MWLVTCSGWYDNTRYYLNELFLLKQKETPPYYNFISRKIKVFRSLPIHLQVSFQDLLYNEQDIPLIIGIQRRPQSSF